MGEVISLEVRRILNQSAPVKGLRCACCRSQFGDEQPFWSVLLSAYVCPRCADEERNGAA